MEFEFNYVSSQTGLLSSRSTEVKTRFVKETTRVSLPEYLDEEAPLAYSQKDGWGNTNTTRWLNGAHWKIAPLHKEAKVDPLRLLVDYKDTEALYEPLEREGRPPVSLWMPRFGFVSRDKKWHRLDEDTGATDLQTFLSYIRENAAVIGGRFAYRVMEPCIELRIERRDGNKPHLLSGSQSGAFRTTRRRSVTHYQASFLEAEEAANEIVSFSDVGKPIDIAPIPRPDFILEEAFSPTLVETASKYVLEDTFAVLAHEADRMSQRSREMVDELKDECLGDGGLRMDALEAADVILQRCEQIRIMERRNLKKLEWFETYVDHDIPVTVKRLEYRRSLDASIETAPSLR